MSRKLEFVERVLEPGAKLSPLCREFGISRPTGRLWRRRYLELGADGLEEESRRPKTSPLSLAEELVAAVLEARDAHPKWGARKLHDLLRRKFGGQTPSPSTVARLLRRFGRIQKRRSRPTPSLVERAPQVAAERPNEIWTVDFKGWWKAHDGSRCEPLTVRDAHSRFIFTVKLSHPKIVDVQTIFEALFRKYGLPAAIQCDNGSPFVNVKSRGGFTRLSAWWVSLGIRLVRSRPGHPQDNGGHERMHRDIASEVESAPASTAAMQQRILDKWRQEFNHVRPHEALNGRTPSEVYVRSERRFSGSTVFSYAPHFIVKKLFNDGHMLLDGERYFVSQPLAGHHVAIERLGDLRCRVWFHHVDCGELEVLPRWVDDLVPPHRDGGFVPPARRASTVSPERHDARRREGRGKRHRPSSPSSQRTSAFPATEPKEDTQSTATGEQSVVKFVGGHP